jgi:hypothetical protein
MRRFIIAAFLATITLLSPAVALAESCCVCVAQPDDLDQQGFNLNWNEGQVFMDIKNNDDSKCSTDQKNKIAFGQITSFICAIKENVRCAPQTVKITNLIEEFNFKDVVLGVTIPSLHFSPPPAQADTEGNIYIPWIGEYIKALYNFAVIVISILAVVMLIVAGAQIIMSAGGPAKAAAYKRITQAVIGLFIAWGSYVILFTINPNLTMFKSLKIEFIPNRGIDGIEETGPSLSKDAIIALVKQVATEKNLDECFLDTIVAKESGYKSNRIGHDENVPRKQVGSRPKFIKSGVKFSGVAFTPDPALITDGKFKNDDGYSPTSPPNYGLDPRFTHGGGLGQFTVLMNKSTKEMTRCSDGNIGRTQNGRCYTFPELMDPKTAVELSADLIKTIGISNPEKLFYRYAGAGCSARVSQCRKMKAYAECKKDPSLANQEVSDCLVWLKEANANCKNPSYRNPTSQPTPDDATAAKEAEEMIDEETGQSIQNY